MGAGECCHKVYWAIETQLFSKTSTCEYIYYLTLSDIHRKSDRINLCQIRLMLIIYVPFFKDPIHCSHPLKIHQTLVVLSDLECHLSLL
jgi:hypothetical protein